MPHHVCAGCGYYKGKQVVAPPTVRGESRPRHRESDAPLAMSRSARISGIFGRLSEEVQTGCSVRRMPADFHHGLLAEAGSREASRPAVISTA